MNPAGKSRDWDDPLLRPIAAASVPSGGLDIEVKPDAGERKALAAALGLASVEQLTARYRLTHRAGGLIAVAGDLVASVQAICVVSLEPFPLRVKEAVETRFGDVKPLDDDEIDMNGGGDPPDPIEDGIIDLGKLTTEFLTLALPMFPRKEDAAFAAEPETGPESPFARLAQLKVREP